MEVNINLTRIDGRKVVEADGERERRSHSCSSATRNGGEQTPGSWARPGNEPTSTHGSQGSGSRKGCVERTIKPGRNAGPKSAKASVQGSSRAVADDHLSKGDGQRSSRGGKRGSRGEATSPTGIRSRSLIIIRDSGESDNEEEVGKDNPLESEETDQEEEETESRLDEKGGEEEKKRGRPVTTGKYEEKKAERARQARLDEERRLRELDDPKVAANLSRNRKVAEERYSEELRYAPVEDLARRIIEQVSTVDKVNSRSKTLRGGDKKCLNEAASMISAAAAHLVNRINVDEPAAGEARVEELRRENARLQEEMAQLRKRAEEGERRAMEAELQKEREKLEKEKKELEAAERNRQRVLREISREGAPAVTRPPLGGKPPVVIEAAIPPEVNDAAMDVEPERTTEVSEELGGTGTTIQRAPDANDSAVLRRVDAMEAALETLTSQLEALVAVVSALAANGARGPGTVAATPQAKEARPGSGPAPARTRSRSQAVAVEGKGGKGQKGRKETAPTIEPGSVRTASEGTGAVAPAIPPPGGAPSQSRPPSPSSPSSPSQSTWAEVVRRKSRNGGKVLPKQQQQQEKQRQQQQARKTQATRGQDSGKGAKDKPQPARGGSGNGARKDASGTAKVGRPPKTAAVVLTSLQGDYETLMREARGKVSLKDLGIDGPLKPKRAQTGALLIELPGKDGGERADKLAASMSALFAGREGVTVTRPVKTGEVRVLDIEDSVSQEEIAAAIADIGKCPPAQVQVGALRAGTNGLRTAWVKCPIAAIRAIQQDKGRLRLGWFSARVQVLAARPLQCFKCLEGGHVRAACTSEVDRGTRCYRCGEEGHVARDCGGSVKCPVCADLGRPSNHRAGGKACSSAKERRKPGKKGAQLRQPAQEAPARETPGRAGGAKQASKRPPPRRTTVSPRVKGGARGRPEESRPVGRPTTHRKRLRRKSKSPPESKGLMR